MVNVFEDKVKDYFDSIGINLAKVPESSIKTPDFEGQELLVEVKSIEPQELEGVHNDSTYNAAKNNLQDASRKFRDYDSSHNKHHLVVVFSADIIADDIFSVWTGSFTPSIPDKIFPSGMLLSEKHKKHIDAVVWFKSVSDSKPQHIWLASDSLKEYFVGLFDLEVEDKK